MSGLPGSRLTVGRSELVGVGGVPDNPIPLLGVGGIAEELCQGLAAADLEDCGKQLGQTISTDSTFSQPLGFTKDPN